MAARRLLAILIVLLIVSSIAAALAPQRASEERTTSSTTTEPEVGEPPSGGALLRERIEPGPPEPVEVEVEPGDQLALTVEVAEPASVAIPALGQSRFATPSDPARFDLLLRDEGRYEVTVGTGERETVAVISAAEPASDGG